MTLKMIALADIGVRVLDCEHKTPAAQITGHPYIAIPQIQDGRIDLTGARRISDADFIAWTRRTKPQSGDIIVTRRGRVGDTAPIPEGVDCAIGQNLVLLRSESSMVDQRYLRWATRGQLWRGEVDRLINVGAVFDSLNVSEIGLMRIPVLPIAVQRSVAATLGVLDDKIESNRRLVALIPQLIRAALSEALALTVQLRDVAVVDLATFVNGGAYTKGASGTGRVVIRIAELNSGLGGSTVYSDIDVPDDKTARPGDILMSWSGSLGVYRWVLDEAIVNQHIFKVLPAKGYPAWLVYDRLDDVMPVFRDIAKDKATTMGHIQRGHLQSTLVQVPSASTIAALDYQLGPLWERLLLAEQESVKLSALRDTLLPELLSGRIRIPASQRAIEEIVA